MSKPFLKMTFFPNIFFSELKELKMFGVTSKAYIFMQNLNICVAFAALVRKLLVS